jgi:hypothetical protein
MPLIEITDFKGVVNSGDLEDIPKEYLAVCKNMRPHQGRLRKTFGFGVKLDSATANILNSLGAYIANNNFGTTPDGATLYIGVYVNSSSKVATVYCWNGSAWAAIASILTNFTGTYYHRADNNPMLLTDNIFRILPGNVGYAVGTSEAVGIFIGYIDRAFFDGLYTFTAGYFNYDTTILAPTFVPVITEIGGGTFNSAGTGLTGLYRMSYVYDGVQESLMSDVISSWSFGTNKALKLAFTLTTSHNKRITAIKVYRALFNHATNVITDYNYIHTIDLLRLTTDVFKGTANAYNAENFIHIPGALSIDFDSGADYAIIVGTYYSELLEVDGGGSYFIIAGDVTADFSGLTYIATYGCTNTENNGVYAISSVAEFGGNTLVGVAETIITEDPTDGMIVAGIRHDVANPGDGTGFEVFSLTGAPAITEDDWDVAWAVCERLGTITLGYGLAGCYTGNKTVAIDPLLNGTIDFPPGAFATGILIFNSVLYYVLTNTRYMIHLGVAAASLTDQAWELIGPSTGMYTCSFSSPNASYSFYDTYLTAGAVHPLDGEKYIKINGEFAQVINGRLWQGNIVLDPGGKNEAHPDWVSYSELDQYDVNPVSNVITIPDREGGAVTGIGVSFGNPVVMKRQGLFFIYTKSAPGTPTSWAIKESKHNIGNIAKHGSIEAAGFLYVVWFDAIYRLGPNNLAETDFTPTENLRITNAIEDTYKALTTTEKETIRSKYDKNTSEILFSWTRTVAVTAVAAGATGYIVMTSAAHGLKVDDIIISTVTGYTGQFTITAVTTNTFTVAGTFGATATGAWETRFVWAYNIITKDWRQVRTLRFPDIYAYDENSDIMVYHDYDKKVYGSTVNEAASINVTTKTFAISARRKEPVRALTLNYKSDAALTAKLYTENSETVKKTLTFPAQTATADKTIGVKVRAKKFKFEITQAESATNTVDIDRMLIEYD